MEKVIDFPGKPRITDEAEVRWYIGIDSMCGDTYSCKYDTEHLRWEITVLASTFQTASAMIEKCRHAFSWDTDASRREDRKMNGDYA